MVTGLRVTGTAAESSRPGRLAPVARCLLAALPLIPANEVRAQAELQDGARDLSGEGLAFVELEATPAEPFLQQRVDLRLRFGLEREFRVERAIQPFGTRLDVPVHLRTDWPAGWQVEKLAAEEVGESVAFDGRVLRARRLAARELEGRLYDTYELVLSTLPTSSGRLRLAPARLELAFATRFGSDLFEARRPLDRVDAFVASDALELDVRPWPTEGRPLEFGGAVGDFALTARLDAESVRLGESLKLELVIRGSGNLADFPVPDWRELGDFRVRGILDEAGEGERVLSLDLAPSRAGSQEVPPVPLAYFDPGPPPSYRVARSGALAVRVLPSEGGELAPRASARPPRPPAPAPPGLWSRTWPWLAGFGALFVLGLLVALRRPSGTA